VSVDLDTNAIVWELVIRQALRVALTVPHLAAKRLTGSTQSVHKETRHTESRTDQLIARL
jgi:hypothetical protein